MVWPCVAALLEATLVRVRSATERTLRTAVAVRELVPTEVVNEPDGMVLVRLPDTELVTTEVTVQLEPGGTTVPDDKVKVPKLAVAAAVPELQLVEAADVALTNPTGYASVNKADTVAETSACVLVIVIVNSTVPPALILVSPKLLATVGLEGETVSISEAEQTPATVQEADALVLETLTGGAIDAMLLTCVWAWDIPT